MKWKACIKALVLVFVFVGASYSQDTAMKLQIGDLAPDFTLEEFSSGKQISLGAFLGKKVVLIEFWATWCDICKSEMSRLQREYSDYKDKGYELISVTLSRGDKQDRDRIKNLVEKYGLTYTILLDKEFEVATKTYGLSGPIPLKVVVDCEKKIRYAHVGSYPEGESEIPFVLDQLLSESACNAK